MSLQDLHLEEAEGTSLEPGKTGIKSGEIIFG